MGLVFLQSFLEFPEQVKIGFFLHFFQVVNFIPCAADFGQKSRFIGLAVDGKVFQFVAALNRRTAERIIDVEGVSRGIERLGQNAKEIIHILIQIVKFHDKPQFIAFGLDKITDGILQLIFYRCVKGAQKLVINIGSDQTYDFFVIVNQNGDD